MNAPIVDHGKNVLALIPARGGSKGLARKNILSVGGQPLIAWTIDAAKNSKVIDSLVLSSEDDEIIEVAKRLGCGVPFTRPTELASDEAKSIDVVLHALQELPGYEYLILLQPTSPLRSSSDIDLAFSLMKERGATSCVSVCQAAQSPYWMYSIQEGDRLTSILPGANQATRRQDLPPAYTLNGAIYISKIDRLLQTKSFLQEDTVAYEMPINRSLDIDNIQDFDEFVRQIENHL